MYNGLSTYYVRDAQGNSLAVYDNAGNSSNWREQTLYGSSRLGMWKPNLKLAQANGSSIWSSYGLKFFELSNHLGNVMAVINDVRQTGNGYEPTVINANSYYAFGAQMPGKSFALNGAEAYRYGFNGKENDNEVKGQGNQQDYGMRIYDPRIGKFLSVDPITNQYPELTPYQFASNTPIGGIDLDGLEVVSPYVKMEQTWYGKTALNTFKFIDAAGKVLINAIAAASEIPAQAHYGNKIKPQDKTAAFPLTNGQNVATLATGIVSAPIFAVGGVVEEPTSATKWGELAGTAILFRGLLKEGVTPPEAIKKGVSNSKVKAAVELGNRVHYDRLNGGIGAALPTELSELYPNTQFRFTRRGQKGADVEVTGGTHPSEYPGSTWKPENNYADFKPDSKSGAATFNREVKSGKLPANTQKLSYDTNTGKLKK